MTWKPIAELPLIAGTYNIAFETGGIELALYSEAHKHFYWYSRRGYTYVIENIKYWIEIEPLPIEDKNGNNDSDNR